MPDPRGGGGRFASGPIEEVDRVVDLGGVELVLLRCNGQDVAGLHRLSIWRLARHRVLGEAIKERERESKGERKGTRTVWFPSGCATTVRICTRFGRNDFVLAVLQ